MNIKTFYTIYYRHRIQKANLLLKIYILLILPFRYLLNIPFLPKKINLDEHSNSNVELFKKDLDYLFEYFNSDKGNYYINQYICIYYTIQKIFLTTLNNLGPSHYPPSPKDTQSNHHLFQCRKNLVL